MSHDTVPLCAVGPSVLLLVGPAPRLCLEDSPPPWGPKSLESPSSPCQALSRQISNLTGSPG